MEGGGGQRGGKGDFFRGVEVWEGGEREGKGGGREERGGRGGEGRGRHHHGNGCRRLFGLVLRHAAPASGRKMACV